MTTALTCGADHLIGTNNFDHTHAQSRQLFIREDDFEPIRIRIHYGPISGITEEEQNYLQNEIIPNSVAFYRSILEVRRIRTPLIFHSELTSCGYMDIPLEHKQSGIEETDVIMYVTVRNEGRKFAAAAQACAYDLNNKSQPYAGSIVVNSYSFDKLSHEALLQMVIHEMAHILAFSQQLFPLYAENSILEETKRGKSVSILTLPTVAEKAQTAFGCSELQGAELEDYGSSGTAGSHWDARVLMHDFMTATLSYPDDIYSDITFAVFADTGWYLVNWEYTSTPKWGTGYDCDFFSKPWLSEGKSAFPEYFWDTHEEDYVSCNYNYLQKGRCQLNYSQFVEAHYQYFDSPFTAGTDSYTDYCPIIVDGTSCRDETQTVDASLGEEMGPESRWFTGTWTTQGNPYNHATCHRMSWEGGVLKVQIAQYEVQCSVEGGNLDIAQHISSMTGIISCPPFDQICADNIPCIKGCSGRGVCVSGVCQCHEGWSGVDWGLHWVSECKTCQPGNPSHCTGCAINAQLSSGRCICASDFTGSPPDCSPSFTCSASWATCSSPNAEDCNSCYFGAELVSPPASSCVCDDRFYGDPSSCIACPYLCVDCEDQITCNTCVQNAQVAVNQWICNETYFEHKSDCWPCPEGCTHCNLTTCSSCSPGYGLWDYGGCRTSWPTGGSMVARVCTPSNAKVIDYTFTDISSTTDSVSGFVAMTGSEENFYPEQDARDPRPTQDRGYFFLDSHLTLPANQLDERNILFATSFTIMGWLKISRSSKWTEQTLLIKQRPEKRKIVHISFVEVDASSMRACVGIQQFEPGVPDMSFATIEGSQSILYDEWTMINVIVKLLSVQQNTEVCIGVNDKMTDAQNLYGCFVDRDDPYTMSIGTDTLSQQNGLHGFLHSFKYFDYAKDDLTDVLSNSCGSTCIFCPAGHNCLSSCGVQEVTLDYGQCTSCHPSWESWDSDCRNCADNYCGQCNEPGCLICEDGYGLMNGSCASCSNSRCRVCQDNFPDKCLLCPENRTLTEDGDCLCSDGYSPVGSVWVMCPSSCKTCEDGSWVTCYPGASMGNDGTCACDSGWTGPATACTQCGPLCSSCNSSGWETCLSHASVTNGQCNWNPGYYYDNESCTTWPAGCVECDATGCITCTVGYELNSGSWSCSANCECRNYLSDADISAKYSDDFTTLVIDFSKDLVVTPDWVQFLEDYDILQPTDCIWNGNNQVIISTSAEFDQTILLNPTYLYSDEENWGVPSPLTIIPIYNNQEQTPVAIIDSFSVFFTECEQDLELSAQQSSAVFGQTYYSWNIQELGIIQPFSHENDKLSIPYSQLRAGVLNVQLTVRDAFARQSIENISVEIINDVGVSFGIAGPRQFHHDHDVIFVASSERCHGFRPSFSWSIVDSELPTMLGHQWPIPRESLEPARSYFLQLKELTFETEIEIEIVTEKSSPEIWLDRSTGTVSVGEDLIVNVNGVEDTNSLNWDWINITTQESCVEAMVLKGNQAILPSSYLKLGEQCQLAVSHQMNEVVYTTTETYSVVDEIVPVLDVTRVPSVISTRDQIVLQSNGDLTSYNITWTQISSHPVDYLTPLNLEHLVLSPDSLGAGLTYTFKISVSSSFAKIQFTTLTPPTNGELLIWPEQGIEMSTDFYSEIFGYRSDHLPLSHRFQVIAGDNTYVVCRSLPLARCEHKLSRLVSEVSSETCDSIGSCATASAKVSVSVAENLQDYFDDYLSFEQDWDDSNYFQGVVAFALGMEFVADIPIEVVSGIWSYLDFWLTSADGVTLEDLETYMNLLELLVPYSDKKAIWNSVKSILSGNQIKINDGLLSLALDITEQMQWFTEISQNICSSYFLERFADEPAFQYEEQNDYVYAVKTSDRNWGENNISDADRSFYIILPPEPLVTETQIWITKLQSQRRRLEHDECSQSGSILDINIDGLEEIQFEMRLNQNCGTRTPIWLDVETGEEKAPLFINKTAGYVTCSVFANSSYTISYTEENIILNIQKIENYEEEDDCQRNYIVIIIAAGLSIIVTSYVGIVKLRNMLQQRNKRHRSKFSRMSMSSARPAESAKAQFNMVVITDEIQIEEKSRISSQILANFIIVRILRGHVQSTVIFLSTYLLQVGATGLMLWYRENYYESNEEEVLTYMLVAYITLLGIPSIVGLSIMAGIQQSKYFTTVNSGVILAGLATSGLFSMLLCDDLIQEWTTYTMVQLGAYLLFVSPMAALMNLIFAVRYVQLIFVQMADRLARIFGTEEDKVNCPFYFKIGACRHGDRCTRLHNKPLCSQTILMVHMYENPAVALAMSEGAQVPERAIREAVRHCEDFYEEVFQELANYGELLELHVWDNMGDHMIGNVYAKFATEDEAENAAKNLNGRYYAGRVITTEYSPVTDFKESRCRQYDEGSCSRGGYCNFMHLKHISRSFRHSLLHQMYYENPAYKAARTDRKAKAKSLPAARESPKAITQKRDSRNRSRDNRDSRDSRHRQSSAERRSMIESWNREHDHN